MNKGFWKDKSVGSYKEKKPDTSNLEHIEDWVMPDEARAILAEIFKKERDRNSTTRLVSMDIKKADTSVLYEHVVSQYELPPFDVSKMDGYAVMNADISGANEKSPLHLDCIGTIYPGDHPDMKIKSGQTVRIMTGAPLPTGADTVIPVEYTDGDLFKPAFFSSFKRGEFITKKGKNISCGTIIAEKGRKIDWPLISLMASCGVHRVNVYKKPIISIFTTGDELADPGENIKGTAKIFNATLFGACSMLQENNFSIEQARSVMDCPKEIHRAFNSAAESDILFFTGGVSRGVKDYVRQVILDNGYEVIINAVCQKPGKPFALFKKKDSDAKGPLWVFGLPGNPVSSLLCIRRLALPAMKIASGEKANCLFPDLENVYLKTEIKNRGKRWSVMLLNTSFNKHTNRFEANYLPMKNSAHIFAMAKADSWVEIAPESTLEKGSIITVFKI